MEVTNKYVNPKTIERYVSTDPFDYFFTINGTEVEIMLTRSAALNTINGERIDNVGFLDKDIEVETRLGSSKFSLSRIKMQWICTSEGGGPCNSALSISITSFLLLLPLIATFY